MSDGAASSKQLTTIPVKPGIYTSNALPRLPSIAPSKRGENISHNLSSSPTQRNIPHEARINDQESPSIPVQDHEGPLSATENEYANAEMPLEPTAENCHVSKEPAALDTQLRARLRKADSMSQEKEVTPPSSVYNGDREKETTGFLATADEENFSRPWTRAPQSTRMSGTHARWKWNFCPQKGNSRIKYRHVLKRPRPKRGTYGSGRAGNRRRSWSVSPLQTGHGAGKEGILPGKPSPAADDVTGCHCYPARAAITTRRWRRSTKLPSQ